MKKLACCTVFFCSMLPLASHAVAWNSHMYAGYGTGIQYSYFRSHNQEYYEGASAIGNAFYHMNSSTWFNQLFVGFGATSPTGWYLGLETDANLTNARGIDTNLTVRTDEFSTATDTHQYSIKQNWSFDIDALLGHTFHHNWLIYGKFGFLTGEYKMTNDAEFVDTITPDTKAKNYGISFTQQLYGGILGLGLRHLFHQHWFIGTEADFYAYLPEAHNQNVTVLNSSGNTFTRNFSYKPNINGFIGKFQLGYLF